MGLTDRQRAWNITAHLIEALGPHFGVFKGTAMNIAYDNIVGRNGKPPQLSDIEVRTILNTIAKDMNAD